MSEDHHLGEDLAALALDDAGAKARHEAHVGTCAACRRAVEESRRVMVALAMPVEAPSPGFDRALWARLDALDQAAEGSLGARIRAWWQRPAAWALTGAAACAVAGAVLVLRAPDGGGADELAAALASVDEVELAENLELLDELELVEELDAIEDLEAIEALEEDGAG